jgi:hypothetical protein
LFKGKDVPTGAVNIRDRGYERWQVKPAVTARIQALVCRWIGVVAGRVTVAEVSRPRRDTHAQEPSLPVGAVLRC